MNRLGGIYKVRRVAIWWMRCSLHFYSEYTRTFTAWWPHIEIPSTIWIELQFWRLDKCVLSAYNITRERPLLDHIAERHNCPASHWKVNLIASLYVYWCRQTFWILTHVTSLLVCWCGPPPDTCYKLNTCVVILTQGALQIQGGEWHFLCHSTWSVTWTPHTEWHSYSTYSVALTLIIQSVTRTPHTEWHSRPTYRVALTLHIQIIIRTPHTGWHSHSTYGVALTHTEWHSYSMHRVALVYFMHRVA